MSDDSDPSALDVIVALIYLGWYVFIAVVAWHFAVKYW